MKVAQLVEDVKDILFPVFCLDCGREGEWVCDTCASGIPISGVFCCPVCHAEQEKGRCCQLCVGNSNLSSHVAITPYKEHALIGRMIHTLKYQYAEDVLTSIQPLIQKFLMSQGVLYADIDVVVPVPLHPRRYAERGFNQADLLAKIIGEVLHVPVENWVIRTRYTPHQALLARLERLKNVAGAFSVPEGVNITGKKILLIDDVFTTGSTLQECAKALHYASSSGVQGFSLARG